MRRNAVTRALKRGLTWPLVPFAILIVLFDDLFRSWVKPAVARLAQLAPFRRLEAWIRTLGPYQTMALFVVPMVVIWPLKLFALYLIGAGRVVTGVLVLVGAKIVGVGIAERLFAVSRDKLLSVAWFRRAYGWSVGVKEAVHAYLRRTRLWTVAGAVVARIRAGLGAVKARLKAVVQARRGGGLLASARRLATRHRLRATTRGR